MEQSSPKNKKFIKTNQTQTEVPVSEENSCQAPNRKSISIQTDDRSDEDVIYAKFDENSMLIFLKKVTPLVCSVLETNNKSKAYDRFKLSSEELETSISCLYILEKPFTGEEEVSCCNLSWNCVGSAIAACYSYNNHMSWCEHDSFVNIWSLNRKDFDTKKPYLSLETDCCITYISFHPTLPAIIVAGKLNGEILLWDISKEDDHLLGSTKAALCNHREPITGIHWLLQYGKSNKINFASCSLDGKILLWKYENNILQPYDAFIVLANQLPRNFQIKTRKDNAEIGITSMSINSEDSSLFIIGIEGGGIFQCSFETKVDAMYSEVSSISMKNPINMCFEKHKGQVTSVQFSPFSRNIFLSAGSDGELRIYSLLQPKPVITLQQLSSSINAAQWSTIRPLVLSCVCNNGQLHIWDLIANEKNPVISCLLSLDMSAGLSLENNKENSSLLGTSCSNGNVQVWELSGSALVPDSTEVLQLQSLSKNID